MNRPSPLRFFCEILRPGRAAIAALASVLAYATYLTTTGDYGFDNALALVLLSQVLVASTGYRDALVRGHFDAVLAGRERRLGVAFAHAAFSMLPGLVLWLAFGAVSYAVGRPSFARASGGLLAIADVSVIAWAVSLLLGRNTGGVLWICGLFVLAAAGRVHQLRLAYGTVSEDWFVRLKAAGAAVVFPLAMYENGGYVEPPIRLLVGVAILAIFAAGIRTIVRLDAPLRDPS